MISHRVAGAPLDFAALRAELAVPGDFPPDVVAEAEASARHVSLPDDDATDIPFVTIDPAGSRDLDQAVHIAPDGDGFVVSYAIADVASFVAPGGALDAETHRRGETLYFPDARVPLHPPQLSEGAASLLPDQICPAVLWRIRLDDTGMPTDVDVRRARVRSTAQWDYVQAQSAAEAGTLPDAIRLLPTVGALRTARARDRHAIDLDLPQQEVEADGNGQWRLQLRRPLPIEQHNAEISLLTGMCAAQLMLQAKVGVLRTIPPPDPAAVESLRRAATALGVDWPDGAAPGDVLSTLDRADPHAVVLLDHAASLLRGAAYTAFDTTLPEVREHSGIGAPYAHVTAPLRRLVDRFGSEICLAAHGGTDVPAWVRAALPQLPAEMQQADHTAHAADRAVVDATEAWLLRDRVGDTFAAVVLEANRSSGTVAIDEPPVRAKCSGEALPVGERIEVRLVTADVEQREVRFERAGQASSPASTVTALPDSTTR